MTNTVPSEVSGLDYYDEITKPQDQREDMMRSPELIRNLALRNSEAGSNLRYHI